jgi:hypothetical protein
MLFEKIKLEETEEVLTIVRKHWFIIVTELFGTFMMLILPFFLLFILAILPSELINFKPFLSSHTTVFVFAVAAWSLICLLTGFTIWTHYFLDLWIITDRRIILIDQVNFFNRNVSIFRLERLQDIEFIVKGIIPTLLNFGTIKAQTAGAHESNFTTNGLPDPRSLQAIIQSAMDRRLQELHVRPDHE